MFKSEWLMTARRIRREPLFTLTIALSMGLGIFAATAAFNLFDSLFLKPLPGVPDARSLQLLMEDSREYATTAFSYTRFQDLQSGLGRTLDLSAYTMTRVTIRVGEDTQQLWALLVSDDFFSTLRITPFMGSWFKGHNESQVVLSYRYWQRQLHGDPSVIGKQIVCNNQVVSIVGVAAPDFMGPYSALNLDFYLPLASSDTLHISNKRLADPQWHWISLIGRLKPGVSATQSADMARLLDDRLNRRDGVTSELVLELLPFWKSPMGAQVVMGPVTASLAGLAVLVLLIALSNSVSLLLLRNDKLQRQFAVQIALGASKRQLWRSLLPECLVATIPGALLGLAISYLFLNNLQRLIPRITFPLYIHFRFTLQALLFCILLGLAMALLLALFTALGAFSLSVNAMLRQTGHQTSASKLQKNVKYLLLASQISLSVFLIGAANMFLRSIALAKQVPLGFQPQEIYAVQIDLAHSGLNALEQVNAYRNLSLHASQTSNSALSTSVPFSFEGRNKISFQTDSSVQAVHRALAVDFNAISPGYLKLLQTPLLVGRNFSETDDEHHPRVVIVNQALAKRLWKDSDAIGRTVRVGEENCQIIGITVNLRFNSLRTEDPFVFLPLLQYSKPNVYLQRRSSGPPYQVFRALRQDVRTIVPGAAIISDVELSAQLETAVFPQRIAGIMCLVFGYLGVFLSGVGIHAAVQQIVRSRMKEIGLRIAFGASRLHIRSVVVREIGVFLLAGIAVGLICAVFAGRLAAKVFPGFGSSDISGLAIALAAMMAAALVAVWRPLSIALKVDLSDLLRNE